MSNSYVTKYTIAKHNLQFNILSAIPQYNLSAKNYADKENILYQL